MIFWGNYVDFSARQSSTSKAFSGVGYKLSDSAQNTNANSVGQAVGGTVGKSAEPEQVRLARNRWIGIFSFLPNLTTNSGACDAQCVVGWSVI